MSPAIPELPAGRLDVPDFLVIGAAKSGTTALGTYLHQHPSVFLPRREEPSYWAFAGARPQLRGPDGTEAAVNNYAVWEPNAYRALYADAPAAALTGDVSPAYLYWPGTAERIAAHRPDARLVVVLRHPVERAYSAFLHACREAREPLQDFGAAVAAEPERISAAWGLLWRYVDLGYYGRQLEAYYRHFSREQIGVWRFEDLARDAVTVCRQIAAHVGLDESFSPDVRRAANVSGVPRNRSLYRLLTPTGAPARALRRLVPPRAQLQLRSAAESLRTRTLRRPPLPAEQYAALLERYRDDIARLSDLTARDFGAWLAPVPPPSAGAGAPR